jgi:hypothetical protein
MRQLTTQPCGVHANSVSRISSAGVAFICAQLGPPSWSVSRRRNDTIVLSGHHYGHGREESKRRSTVWLELVVDKSPCCGRGSPVTRFLLAILRQQEQPDSVPFCRTISLLRYGL